MIKRETRKATCDNWVEEIRAPIDVDEYELAEQFMRKRSLPFFLTSFSSPFYDGVCNDGRSLLWRFEDRFGTTIRFEVSLGTSTEAWLKP